MNSIEKYEDQLKEIETKFDCYQKEMDNIISKVSSSVVRTVITYKEIVNRTPYWVERLGRKLSGTIIPSAISSDDCIKYHYDSENRIVMIEDYSTFLKKFILESVYLHNDLTEELVLSGRALGALRVFDNPFSNTKLELVYSSYTGYIVEEFIYDGDVLVQIQTTHGRTKDEVKTETREFTYKKDKLSQILRVCPNGYTEFLYSTKKPHFKKIKDELYTSFKKLIEDHPGDFTAFGIEGFLNQNQPMLCVCFTNEKQPSDLIADWKTEMHPFEIYNCWFDDCQMEKCVKVIAEIIVVLVEEGLLKDKQIYFRQSQVCVTKHYSGARNVFKKANLAVR